MTEDELLDQLDWKYDKSSKTIWWPSHYVPVTAATIAAVELELHYDYKIKIDDNWSILLR